MEYVVTIQKTFADPQGDDILYTFTSTGATEEDATRLCNIYATMVEFGRFAPRDLPFPREQLYQFIQPSQLDIIESMYPDAVQTAYDNALAYVQSYIGNMFDVEEMLSEDGGTSCMTLRLALLLSTVTYVLSSSPQYAEVIEMHNKQLHQLLRGVKSGNRNMGKSGIAADPNVRVTTVNLTRTGNRP